MTEDMWKPWLDFYQKNIYSLEGYRQPRDHIAIILNETVEDLRLLTALALSVCKWHPSNNPNLRGCALCVYYYHYSTYSQSDPIGQCRNCVLTKNKQYCESKSGFHRGFEDSLKWVSRDAVSIDPHHSAENDFVKAASYQKQLYELLMELYRQEYQKHIQVVFDDIQSGDR